MEVQENDEFVEIRARFRPQSEFMVKFIELLEHLKAAQTVVPGGSSHPEVPAPKLDEREAMSKLFERLSPNAKDFCCLLAARNGEWVSASDAKEHLKVLAMSGLTSRISYAAKKLGLTFDQLLERHQDDEWRLFYRLTSSFAEIVEDALSKGQARRTLIPSPQPPPSE
jgi:hypothetical protein